jgi:hypothetical protein
MDPDKIAISILRQQRGSLRELPVEPLCEAPGVADLPRRVLFDDGSDRLDDVFVRVRSFEAEVVQ